MDLTLFSWGFWGWGTATKQLVEAVDAVEGSRGYKPPLFVDVRIQRSGRAPGFQGAAFEKRLGPSRYVWMDDLGNLAIRDRGPMRIKNPAAAASLLDQAVARAKSKQRVIFFCACEFPGTVRRLCCHRVEVASLVLKAARKHKAPTEIVEWPGGAAARHHLELSVPPDIFKKLLNGRTSIPLTKPFSLGAMGSLPWGSLVTLRERDQGTQYPGYVVSGPAKYKKGGWYLPVLGRFPTDTPAAEVRQAVAKWRLQMGFEPRKAIPS
jgi:hypothetical protein